MCPMIGQFVLNRDFFAVAFYRGAWEVNDMRVLEKCAHFDLSNNARTGERVQMCKTDVGSYGHGGAIPGQEG